LNIVILSAAKNLGSFTQSRKARKGRKEKHELPLRDSLRPRALA
jgi:hypothetical protein